MVLNYKGGKYILTVLELSNLKETGITYQFDFTVREFYYSSNQRSLYVVDLDSCKLFAYQIDKKD